MKSIFKFISPRYQSLFLEYKVDAKPRGGEPRTANPYLNKLVEAGRSDYKYLLEDIPAFQDAIQSIRKSENESSETEPVYNNGFLPGLDIITLYSFIAKYKPERYIEIGSGNSTKVARKCIRDQKLNTSITSIDPYPRASIDMISDEIMRIPLEQISDLSFIDALDENDFLFIDNSHRSFPNSDVTVCFLEILPRLKKGVIVQIHDIYLPYDYPQFMCDRYYNEQYLLACLLLGGGSRYEVLMPNFFVSEDPELSAILSPVWDHPNLEGVERHGGSFWLRIRE